MSSTNKTTYYELSQYVGTDKPTYLGDYNTDMSKIDTAIHDAATDASSAISTANAASSAATAASASASAAVTTANAASATATEASNTAGTALTNAGAALAAAENAETKAKANDITIFAPAYDSTLTYNVDDLVTYVDENGTGKLYKCIVAVSTPEAFNVNKWDDVTTNAIYEKKGKLIASVTADGVLTLSEILDTIYNSISIDLSKKYTLTSVTNTSVNAFNLRSVHTNYISFSQTGIYSVNSGDIIDLTIASSSESYIYNIANNSITNAGNNVPASGTTYNLYEF